MNSITSEMKKQLAAQHQVWLSNPITQMVLSTIQQRLKGYDDNLIDHIRQVSDKEFEDKHRSAISTCKAILVILNDTETFIQHSTKQPTNEQ